MIGQPFASLVDTAKDIKGVAVLADELDGDVGVLGFHHIYSSGTEP